MFKNIFIKLCNSRGESPSFVCRNVGIAPATFSCWTDESIPRQATLQRIADYFGVSVDYLLGKTEKPANEGELTENVVIFHRNGKTVKRKFTKEQLALFHAMLDAIPEDDDEDDI